MEDWEFFILTFSRNNCLIFREGKNSNANIQASDFLASKVSQDARFSGKQSTTSPLPQILKIEREIGVSVELEHWTKHQSGIIEKRLILDSNIPTGPRLNDVQFPITSKNHDYFRENHGNPFAHKSKNSIPITAKQFDFNPVHSFPCQSKYRTLYAIKIKIIF